ncbi:MAG TPA: M4 family metallopeptidase [Ferruginibacter sp.]|nr:M4 family metallopeptidase [Bacteroidota bacterium]MCC6692010.1 M4 family metallopeptidase [Chitinophagaceae bacterium]HMT96789.1 M4 family metallopeptidase [Ferruginibacter sp.]HMU24663.1 M4 family metallopeptidase [Ferruginibacter sp.]HRD43171.1 M4 family metallopeptidase [Ferruginibacter sp.]
MCQHTRNPLQCIIPPYITDKLKALSTGDNDMDVDFNLSGERRFRNRRKALSKLSVKKRYAMANAYIAEDAEEKIIEIYDAGQLPILPGELIWQTGESPQPKDKIAKEAIRGAEKTLSFYKSLFSRNSVDNNGMVIQQSIHYRENPRKTFANAMWDGTQMIFGDGDGITFGSFTGDLDIIAHELTHGVIDYEANLTYKNQSGALNESFADVFGILVKQWANNTSARKSNWLIGDKILLGKKYALRSMKAPGTAYKNHPELGDDPQPAVMSNYIKMTDDDGGVHYNSGIPNHAFYVAAYEMAGNAWEKAGAIWYAALTDKKALKKSATFKDARKATIAKAKSLFGAGSKEVKAVTKGWDEAEVK